MMPREGAVIADRYRLERKIGGGRVAAVWRVQDEVTEGTCAIKLLHRSMHKHAEALTRFSLEDRLARELSGPYFAERIGSGSWDSMRYIAWRWYEGECLRSLFERNPKQDAPTVHSIVQETCQALGVVHAAGYTHGDLKPENLFFADRGEKEASRQLKLLGFGVAARIAPANAALHGRRKAGQIVGTPLYLSPDLILGHPVRGGAGDLWALAVIVYEALTGRVPFFGPDLPSVLEAILERRAPKPSSIAEHLPASFDLWWAQAIEQEFRTPNEFAAGLARGLAPALRTSHTQRSASLPERGAIAALGSSSPVASVAAAAANPGNAVPRPTTPSIAAGSQAVGAKPAASPAASAHDAPGQAAAVNSVSGANPATSAAAAAAPSSPAASPAIPAAVPGRGNGSTAITSTGLGPAGPLAPARPSSPAPREPSSDAPEPRRIPSLPIPLRVAGPSAVPSASIGTAPAERAVAASDTGRAVAASEPRRPRASTPALADAPRVTSDTAQRAQFAPLPAPLSDFSASLSRKTLVGITPPAALLAGLGSPSPTVAPSPGPMASLGPAGAPSTLQPNETIEGAPCKPIDVRGQTYADELPASLFEGFRRPANPTVPFPRPRVSPRFEPADDAPEDQPYEPEPSHYTTSAGTWRSQTTRTIRFVLASADHKPQRIAGVVVCAAAALVIFLVGRSPIGGTSAIDQATEALSADPTTAAPPTAPPPRVLADPPATPEGNAPAEPLTEIARAQAADGTPLVEGEELAPGLVVPASESTPPKDPPLGRNLRKKDGVPRGAAPVAPAPAKRAAGGGDPRDASVPPRATGKKASTEPVPQRRPAGEFDFGI
jgi:serine/threonine protein kinase